MNLSVKILLAGLVMSGSVLGEDGPKGLENREKPNKQPVLTGLEAQREGAQEVKKLAADGELKKARRVARGLVRGVEGPYAKELGDAIFEGAGRSVGKNDIKEASLFFRMYLDLFPEGKNAVSAREQLLACYNELRELEACIAQAKVNLKKDPESAWVDYWTFIYGYSHFRLWKFDEAKPLLEDYLKKFPKGKHVKMAKKYLGYINPDWEIGDHGLVKYEGKFKDDIRIKRSLATLEKDLEAGYAMVEEILGVNLRENVQMLILLADAKPGARNGLKGQAFVVGVDNKPVTVVRIFTHFLAASPNEYQVTLAHELKHAGFKGLMGQSYENLPSWVKEGLAVYGTRDTETRMYTVLCNEMVGKKDPLKTLDGIDDPKHTVSDYMEDALAFEWLDSLKEGNVKAYCQGLLAGKDYKKLFAEVSGLGTYEAAMKAANAYCRKRVEAVLGSSYGEYRKLRQESEANMGGKDVMKKWLDDGGREKFETWLKVNDKNPAAPMVRFCYGRSLVTAGEGEGARKMFRHILEKDRMRCTLLDDAQLWLGLSYYNLGDKKKGIEEFGVLLRDYPTSSSSRKVRGARPAGPVLK